MKPSHIRSRGLPFVSPTGVALLTMTLIVVTLGFLVGDRGSMMAAPAADGDTEQTSAPAMLQAVRLKSGSKLQGRVVKRNAKSLFLDIGYTILSIPNGEIDKVEALEKKVDGKPGNATPLTSTTKESIFHTARLEPGAIKDKSLAVGESVVRVLTLSGSGSGFVIDEKEGYIVTNYHVVEREREIAVMIYVREDDGLRKVRIDKLQIIALNPFFDLALLKLADPKAVPLRKCYLGDYSRVRVGDPVFAIGNPLGLERTVSDGIVSNRNRTLGGQLAIQTTAAINPGNSGGPLFNPRGEVIGVTSSKMLGGESLGFAIPIHYVKDFLRHKEAYAFDKDNPNTGVRYVQPPPKPRGDENKKVSSKNRPGARDKRVAGDKRDF